MEKMAKIRVDDLEMRPDMFGVRLKRRAMLRNSINDAMPVIDKAVEKYNLNTQYDRALDLVSSGRAREAFDLGQEKIWFGIPTDETLLDKVACLPAVWLKLEHEWLRLYGLKLPILTTTLGMFTKVYQKG